MALRRDPYGWATALAGVVSAGILVLATQTAAVASSGATAHSAAVPQYAVAIVADRAITHRVFRHWTRIALRDFRKCPCHGHARRSVYRRAVRETMSFLITSYWLIGEAEREGARVPPSEVRRELERTKRENFRSERAYRRFLRDAGETTTDVLFRTRLTLLAGEIRSRSFPTGWRQRTRCKRGFFVPDCANNPPSS